MNTSVIFSLMNIMLFWKTVNDRCLQGKLSSQLS